MWKYFMPFIMLGGVFVLAAFDAVIYYGQGKHHSIIPLIACGAVTLAASAIAIMATYETFKHRNDKEPW